MGLSGQTAEPKTSIGDLPTLTCPLPSLYTEEVERLWVLRRKAGGDDTQMLRKGETTMIQRALSLVVTASVLVLVGGLGWQATARAAQDGDRGGEARGSVYG